MTTEHHSQRTLSCSVLGACSATVVHSVRPKVVPHGEKCEVTAVVKESWDIKLDQDVGKGQIPTCWVGKMTQSQLGKWKQAYESRYWDTQAYNYWVVHHSYTEGYTVLEQSARLWRHDAPVCFHAARNTFELWPSTFDRKPADSA